MSFVSKTRNPVVAERYSQWYRDIKAAADGRGGEVVIALGNGDISRIAVKGKAMPCPIHNSRSDGYRAMTGFADTGATCCNSCGFFTDWVESLKFLNGWDFKTTMAEAARYLGVPHPYEGRLEPRAYAPKPQIIGTAVEEDPQVVARRDAKRREDLQKLWDESVDIFHPDAGPARRYLKNRGISCIFGKVPDIRFHPSAIYYHDEYVDESGRTIKPAPEYFPAVLMMLRQPDLKPMTIQRTFITSEGVKAPVGKPKKQMPRVSTAVYHGSAARLDHKVGTVLCVGEGMETMLSFRHGVGLPSWSCTSADLLKTVEIPDQVQVVAIAADLNSRNYNTRLGAFLPPVGEVKAEELAERIRDTGRVALVFYPDGVVRDGQGESVDWNDLHKRDGEGFTENEQILTIRSAVAHALYERGLTWESALPHS